MKGSISFLLKISIVVWWCLCGKKFIVGVMLQLFVIFGQNLNLIGGLDGKKFANTLWIYMVWVSEVEE